MYIVLCTVPGNVIGILLTCDVMDQINQCIMDWNVNNCLPYMYCVHLCIRICKYVTYVYTYLAVCTYV